MNQQDALTEAIEVLNEVERNADSNGEGHYAQHLQDVTEALSTMLTPEGHYRLSDLTEAPVMIATVAITRADRPKATSRHTVRTVSSWRRLVRVINTIGSRQFTADGGSYQFDRGFIEVNV